MFLGKLEDGRYVVASRWEVEIRTRLARAAQLKFEELCPERACFRYGGATDEEMADHIADSINAAANP